MSGFLHFKGNPDFFMTTFADSILAFLTSLDFQGKLPEGISMMNPFRDNPEILPVVTQFYKKYYNDKNNRTFIIGINPGRFGAGATGIPFTDSKRLIEKCGISVPGLATHETSSVFVYDMIERYGGVEKFYSDYYISSVCPLGFTTSGKSGKEVNYNYYDSKGLTKAVYDFIVETIRQQIRFGLNRETCFCLGTGKNFKFLTELNEREKFFKDIIPLEHPRFIMQYRSKEKNFYIDSYLRKLNSYRG